MSRIIDDGPLVADRELIVVRSNLPAPQEYKRRGNELHLEPSVGRAVALWERDPAHPGGEVLVAGDRPVRVARTERVVEKLRDGELVQLAE